MNLRKKILIIDDEPDILAVLKARLKRNNYDVITSSDGNTGLRIAEHEKLDLIILDVLMPNINGWEVCEKLKENESTRHIPVIFLTASLLEDNMPRARALGAEHFLMKPFEPKQVLDIVRQIIGRNESEKKEYIMDEWRQIQRKFLNRVRKKLNFIDEALQKYPADYSTIYREVHSIRGVSGTLGFSALGNIAEKMLKYIDLKKKNRSNKELKKMLAELWSNIPLEK